MHEVGREQDTVFIVSDFVEGVTLADRLTAQRFSVREAAELCAKIADALHHAHEARVIHRDLKPSNIILDAAGEPHIMDFGLARREAGEVTMTVEGRVIGTPAYMSPEQAKGAAHTADRRSDVYSLGVILFELLTGERPFRGNIRMLVHQVINDEPPSPRRLNGAVPPDLETIVLKCMEKPAEKRYMTAQDLADDLRRFVAGDAIRARPITRVARACRWCKRKPVAAGLAVAIVLGLVGTTTGLVLALQAADRAAASRHEAEYNLYSADLQRAMDALLKGNRRETERLLTRQKIMGEGQFEWNLVWEMCRRSQPKEEFKLSGIPIAGHLSDDGNVLAVSQANGTICLINRQANERREWILESFKPSLLNSFLSLTSDGKWIAYPTENAREIRIHNIDANATKTICVPNSDASFSKATFCPHESRRWLATGDTSGVITLWDWETSEIVKQARQPSPVIGIAWSAEAQRLISCGPTDISVWDCDLHAIQTLRLAGSSVRNRIGDIAVSPSGRRIAAVCIDQTIIRVWDVDSGEEIAVLANGESIVEAIRFASDATLISAGRDNAISVWDRDRLRKMQELRGHSGYIWWLAGPTADGHFASGGMDGRVMVWNPLPSPGKISDFITFNAGQVRDMSLSPDDKLLAITANDYLPQENQSSRVVLVDTIELTPIRTLPVDFFVQSVAFSPHGSLAVGGGVLSQRNSRQSNGCLMVWNSLTDASPRNYADLPGWVQYVRYSPDGKYLAVSCDNGCVVFDTETGEREQQLPEMRTFHGLAWSIDSNCLAVGSNWYVRTAPGLKVWDLTIDQLNFDSSGPHDHMGGVMCMAFSPDGKLLASGGLDGQVHLREVVSGKCVAVIEAHSGFIWCLEFSPDGRTLFSGSGDDRINIWDVEREELRLSFPAHRGGTKALAVSRCGSMLFSGGLKDGTLRVWRSSPAVK